MPKKSKKTIPKEKEIPPEKIEITKEERKEKKEEVLEEKILDSEEEMTFQKFTEFLAPSTELVQAPAQNKARSLERDEEVLLTPASSQDEKKQEPLREDYSLASPRGPDYKPLKIDPFNIQKNMMPAGDSGIIEAGNIRQEFIKGEGRIINPELESIRGRTEKEYLIKEEIVDKDIKYKSRRFR